MTSALEDEAVGYVSIEQSRAGGFLPKDAPNTPAGQQTVVPRIIRAYFGQVKEVEPGPQGFLVDNYPVHSTIRAHFHPTDQFQIFFSAPGVWYKSDPVEGILLHYADANVTYGPFGTKDHTFSFFTLRQHATARTNYLPEDREQLPPPPRPRHRNLHVDVPENWRGDADVTVRSLIAPHDDGLSADLVRLGAGERRTLEQAGPSAGRYYCVIDGALEHNGREYGPLSLAWVPAQVSHDDVVAGPDGSTFLVLQFPAA